MDPKFWYIGGETKTQLKMGENLIKIDNEDMENLSFKKMLTVKDREFNFCVELRLILSESRFLHESVVIHSYILVNQI